MEMTMSATTPQKKLREGSIRTTVKPSPSSATALAATLRALSLNIAPPSVPRAAAAAPPASLRGVPVAAVGRNDLRCHRGGGLLHARGPPPLGHRQDVHVDTPAGLRLGGDQAVQPAGFLLALALAVPPGDVAQAVAGAEAAVQVACGADVPHDAVGDECEHAGRLGEGELGLDPAERAQSPRRVALLDGCHPGQGGTDQDDAARVTLDEETAKIGEHSVRQDDVVGRPVLFTEWRHRRTVQHSPAHDRGPGGPEHLVLRNTTRARRSDRHPRRRSTGSVGQRKPKARAQATASARVETPNFLYTLRTWDLTVFRVTNSRVAICSSVMSSSRFDKITRSRRVRGSEAARWVGTSRSSIMMTSRCPVLVGAPRRLTPGESADFTPHDAVFTRSLAWFVLQDSRQHEPRKTPGENRVMGGEVRTLSRCKSARCPHKHRTPGGHHDGTARGQRRPK